MKAIMPNYKIWPRVNDLFDEVNVYRHIEQIARVCYKSTNKNGIDSTRSFIGMLRDKKHWAMLEHYIFRAVISTKDRDNILKLYHCENPYIQEKLKYIRFVNLPYGTEGLEIFARDDHDVELIPNTLTNERKLSFGDNELCIMIFSATALNYLIEAICNFITVIPTGGLPFDTLESLAKILSEMKCRFPLLFNMPDRNYWGEYVISYDIFWSEKRKILRLLSDEDIEKYAMLHSKSHDVTNFVIAVSTMSVLFTVGRGVTHELVRHRPASYAQESTRYCNYGNGKFGHEISCVIPTSPIDSVTLEKWCNACTNAEKSYFDMIDNGVTPQIARGVLPTDLKADITVTATLDEWLHIFDMRCDKPAHPSIKTVMIPLYKEVAKYYEDKFNIDIGNSNICHIHIDEEA